MADIGIIGYGIVGMAVAEGFRLRGNKTYDHTIRFYDKYKDSDSLEDVARESEYIFVSLPTPFKGNDPGQWSIDLSIMDENIEQLVKYIEGTGKILAIKSTVVPGTTRSYAEQYPGCNFAFNPEFLREATYIEDFIKADHHVVGADIHQVGRRLVHLYREQFPDVPVHATDTMTAEAVKYFKNMWLAVNVMYANEWKNYADAKGMSYEEIMRIASKDSRLPDYEINHLKVTSLKGFGGKCLPKDTVALMGDARDEGVSMPLVQTAWEENLRIRQIHDWLDIPWAKTEDKGEEK